MPAPRCQRSIGAGATLLVMACSGHGEPTIEAQTDATHAVPTAAGGDTARATPKTLTFPQVLSRGGPIIKTPRVQPIFFAGDGNVARIDAFGKVLARDPYWSTAAVEYGVGAITQLPPIVITPAPSRDLDSTELERWLATKLSDGTLGAPDPGTLYAVFLADGTTLTENATGAKSCQSFAGYHYELDVRGVSVGYALIPDCKTLTEMTAVASHEYFEWATDPFPSTKPAYNKLTPEHWAWEASMMGELTDLCDFVDGQHITLPGGFAVSRHWSNRLSREGKFPCAPVRSTPYFQAVALADDEAIVPDYGSDESIRTRAIRVPKGGSRTVDVFVYADQPLRDVAVGAESFGQMMGIEDSMGFAYRVSRDRANVGESVQLTVDAPREEAFDLLAVFATVDNERFFWPVLVVNDDAAMPAQNVSSVRRAQLPGVKHGARTHTERKFLRLPR